MAKDAADIVLLDKDLGVLATGVTEGRRIFTNTLKYVLMATSSNFGNMFSAAGASLFLTYLPMLPSQILLNGLLYDLGQLAIPTDRVDPEILARPAGWDIAFVRRFMFVFGPISSLFDIATFVVMIHVLHAGRDEFRTGWFVESLVTQTLVVYLIRTRRVPFLRSRPSRAMLVTPVIAAALGIAVAFSPAAHLLGFARRPGGLLPHPVGHDRALSGPDRGDQVPLLPGRPPAPPPAAHRGSNVTSTASADGWPTSPGTSRRRPVPAGSRAEGMGRGAPAGTGVAGAAGPMRAPAGSGVP